MEPTPKPVEHLLRSSRNVTRDEQSKPSADPEASSHMIRLLAFDALRMAQGMVSGQGFLGLGEGAGRGEAGPLGAVLSHKKA